VSGASTQRVKESRYGESSDAEKDTHARQGKGGGNLALAQTPKFEPRYFYVSLGYQPV
jgi:hypothetical protein